MQVCLYSVFTLYIVISAAHNPTAVYRVVRHIRMNELFAHWHTRLHKLTAGGIT
jgi:hypothetical protein